MQNYLDLTTRRSEVCFVFESFNYRKNISDFWSRNKYSSYATTEQSKFGVFEKLSLIVFCVCLVHPD